VGLGFNCNVIVPLLLLFAASPLCLDTGMFFFGGFQHPPVDGGSTARCDFGVLIGEDEHIGEDVVLLFHLSNFQIQRSPTFLVAGTGFVKDSFSANLDRGWGWFWDDSNTLFLLCTFFILLYQLHLGSPGIRSWRLGTPTMQYY